MDYFFHFLGDGATTRDMVLQHGTMPAILSLITPEANVSFIFFID